MAVKTIRYADMGLENPVAIIGFPSVGLVSSIMANYMVGQLEMGAIAGLSSPTMPPYCLIHRGVAYPPVRFYGRKHTTKTGRDLIVCLSEYAPKPEDCYEVVQAILSYLNYAGCRDIICLEGTARMSEDDVPVVCGVGPGSDKMIKKSKFALMEGGMVKGITGVMLTKLDGDARGGAALSIKALTGKPIKFAGIGEKLDQIEPFHPDRMAGRILGMGDVLTLIEKAEQNLDQKKAEEMAERLRQNRFTLTDYYDQLQQLKGMGSLQDIAGMIPGMDAKALSGANVDEKAMGRIEAIIQSMTPGERDNPGILNSSRKKRIAAGAGTSVVEINKLLKQFDLMQQLVRQMSGNSKAMKRMKRGGRGGLGGLGNLFGGGGGRPFGF